MKKRRILALVLSLALLVGAVVGIGASASETDGESYAVKVMNVAYGDRVQVLVAIDAPLDKADEIEVKYTIGGVSAVATYWGDEYAVEIDGVKYPVYYTAGISPKDCGESVLVWAYEKGSEPASPVKTDVSVAGYLYTMLYREGYINATEGENLDKKDFYVNALEYIASAQKVLWNNKAEHKDEQRALVTDRVYVYASDAKIASTGGSSALLDAAGNVKLSYTGKDLFLGWNVITASGTELVKSDTVFVSEAARIEPAVIVRPAGEDFESEPISKTEVAITSGSAIYNHTFASGMTVNYGAKTNEGPTGTQGSVIEVLEENGNKYLHISSPGRNSADTDKAPSITIDAQNHSGFSFDANKNVAILEFDMKASSASKFQDISFTAGVSVSDNGYGYGGIKFATNGGDWVNVRIEGYKAEKMVQVYVDGAFVGSFAMPEPGSGADTRMRYVYLNLTNGSGAFDVSYDNFNVYHVEKEYEAVPTLSPKTEDFAGEYTARTVALAGGTSITFSEFEGVSGIPASTSKTNTTGLAGIFVKNVNGNKKLQFFTPGRINADGTQNSDNRAHGLMIDTEALIADAKANTTVFEFEFNYNVTAPEGIATNPASTTPLSVCFGDTDGNEISFFLDCTGGVLTLGGIELGRAGEDINLKFVYSGHTTDRTAARHIDLYVNGEKAGELDMTNYHGASCSTHSEIWGRIGTMNRVRFTGDSRDGNSGMIDFTIDNLKAYTTYIAE